MNNNNINKEELKKIKNREYAKKHYQKHKDTINNKNDEYYWNNRDSILKKRREEREEIKRMKKLIKIIKVN